MAVQDKIEMRKENILKAAEHIFAQKGFHEATISDIAKLASVSEGTIYEYFNNKENLLFQIPENLTRRVRDEAIANAGLIKGAANRLRAIAYIYLKVYQENPDYAVITLLILKSNKKFRETEGYRLITKSLGDVYRVVEKGIANGEFRDDLDPYVAGSVLIGAVDHVAINWLMSDRKRNLLEFVDPILDTIMEGMLYRCFPDCPGKDLHWTSWQRRNMCQQDQE